MRYVIKVFYDGTKYYGYQRQPHIPTIEAEIIRALQKTGHIKSPVDSKFISASRTDRYVSAIGNCFSFNSNKKLILGEINVHLPKDKSIICWASSVVEENFSPRYAQYKKYWYIVPTEFFLKKVNLSYNELQALCKCFEGIHDFKLFAKRDYRHTKRELKAINLKLTDRYIIFEFVAESFLWQQIRRIIAYILNYSKLSKELRDLPQLLQSNTKISDLRLEPANPRNLILLEHHYENIRWDLDRKEIKKISAELYTNYVQLSSKLSVVKIQHEFFSDISENIS